MHFALQYGGLTSRDGFMDTATDLDKLRNYAMAYCRGGSDALADIETLVETLQLPAIYPKFWTNQLVDPDLSHATWQRMQAMIHREILDGIIPRIRRRHERLVADINDRVKGESVLRDIFGNKAPRVTLERAARYGRDDIMTGIADEVEALRMDALQSGAGSDAADFAGEDEEDDDGYADACAEDHEGYEKFMDGGGDDGEDEGPFDENEIEAAAFPENSGEVKISDTAEQIILEYGAVHDFCINEVCQVVQEFLKAYHTRPDVKTIAGGFQVWASGLVEHKGRPFSAKNFWRYLQRDGEAPVSAASAPSRPAFRGPLVASPLTATALPAPARR